MNHTHLTLIERGKLEAYLALNFSCRKIANLLGRHHSTIIREINRNKKDYHSITAQNNYDNRRKNNLGNIKFSQDIITIIEEKLQCTWSPEQIANTVLYGKISFKTIYNWIYEGKINSNNFNYYVIKVRKEKELKKEVYFQMGH